MTSEQVQLLIDATGSLCELQRFYYQETVESGFTKREALELTKNFIAAMFSGKPQSVDYD